MPAAALSTFRVMTWNLWWRFDDLEHRFTAIVAEIARVNPDIVCLQECWAEQHGDVHTAQADVLAARLGLHAARSDSPFYGGLAFENAVLSRWPITASYTLALPNNEGDPGHRRAVLAQIDSPHGTLRAASTHFDYQFDRSATRVAQARALAAWIADHRGDPTTAYPTIIGADFNAVSDSDEIRMLLGRSEPPAPGIIFHDAWELAGNSTPGLTWDSHNAYQGDATWPNRRIDYILVSWPRLKPLGRPERAWLAGVEPNDGVTASDHYAVVADLRC